jgi:predicted Zn-dependent peptidase
MTATLVKSSALNTPTFHHLPNGLTIVAEQMPVEAINLNVWLRVGSALETDTINGMAHFLEHMVFKGTPRLKGGDFERLIEARGAVTNAATSQEYTHYYVTCSPQDFADLTPLQLDVVFNPTIADAAFERERLVILEEIRRAEDNPRRRVFSRAMETCCQRLPYRRSVLGPKEVIENLTPGQMRDFHRQWYQPHNVTVAVVGNQPVERLIATVSKYVEEIAPAHGNEALGTVRGYLGHFLGEPAFTEVIRQEYLDQNLQQARLIMVQKVPGLRDLSETYALDVLAVILGTGKTSRLFRELREERALVSQISATNMTQAIQGAFLVSAQLPVENLDAVERAINQHIRQIQEDSVDQSELERVKTQVANRFIFANERPSDRANLYGYYHSQLGDITPALNYTEIIRSLTLADIQKAAQNYLDTQAYGLVVVKPGERNF